MNKIGFIFAIVVASASCYDFLNDDHLFELPINRFKRGIPDNPHCCGNDFSGVSVKFLGELSEECEPGEDPNEEVKATIIRYICTADCVAKKEGTLQDGEVDGEKVLEFLRSHDKDEYRMQVFEENLDKCIIEAKKIQERLLGKIKCDSTAISLMRCLKRELILNCPEDKQNVNQKKTCDQIKQHLWVTMSHIFNE